MSLPSVGQTTANRVVSRFEHLALKDGVLLDEAAHPVHAFIKAGTLLGEVASGKYRAYVELTVNGAGVLTSSDALPVDQTEATFQYLKDGDVLVNADGDVVGTVDADLDGSVKFEANAAEAVSAGDKLFVQGVDITKGKIMCHDFTVSASAEAVSAFFEGFFNIDQTTVTTAAVTALGASVDGTELRIR